MTDTLTAPPPQSQTASPERHPLRWFVFAVVLLGNLMT